MNKEIKTLWVAELRSGKHTQGNCALYNITKNTKCCLGVLCEIAVSQGIIKTAPSERTGQEDITMYYDGNNGYISETVKEWAELPFEYGDEVSIDGLSAALTYHNDGGRTFEQIATAIEEQL